ncbi:hypothetical protein [Agromyces bauzanensis]
MTEVAWAIASPEGRAKLRWVQPGGRAESISPATFLAAAKEAATYADHGTGRNVTVGRARLGRAVSRSERTMTRFWRAANALGFSRTRAEGRYLTTAERRAAYRRHGNRQLRMAAQRDLIGLRRRGFVHLPSGGGLRAHEALLEMDKHQRASAQEGAPASRSHSPDKRLQNQPATSRPGRVIWAREMFEFARDVRTLLPWLRDAHPASIARVLDRAGVTPERWAARDLARRLEQELGFRANAARFGQQSERPARAFRFMDPNEVSDPLGYTRWLLAEYIDPAEPTLTEDRAEYRADQVQQAVDQLDSAEADEARRRERRAERDARLAEQFARREEARAEREHIAAEAAQIQAIRAESDAAIARRRPSSHS